MVELEEGTRHLRQNKGADSNGIVAKCFVYGGFELLEHLLSIIKRDVGKNLS